MHEVEIEILDARNTKITVTMEPMQILKRAVYQSGTVKFVVEGANALVYGKE